MAHRVEVEALVVQPERLKDGLLEMPLEWSAAYSSHHLGKQDQSGIALFFFNDTATTEIYTLSLHDALPIFPLELARGEDVWVWDTAGKKYMDLYAGHAVCSTGHCHPHVVKAVQEQASKLLFYSNVAGFPLREIGKAHA